MREHGDPTHRCRGAVLVEFVLVAPFLLLMMLGIAELGRMFFQYNTLTKSVREGARYLAGHAPGTINVMVLTQSLRAETANMVVYGIPSGVGSPLIPGLSASDVDIDIVDSINVQVSASFNYTPATVQALPGFGYGADTPLSFTLAASTAMRLL